MANREIDEEGCWIWTGKINANGYGNLGHYRVHIVAYEIFHGERTPGLEILHACDKPLCFRPDCLSEGTHQKNMEDAATRFRVTGNHANKLTYEKAEEIRRRRKEGETHEALALEFGVSQHHIYDVINYNKWKKRKA